jgi:hypothetical protein
MSRETDFSMEANLHLPAASHGLMEPLGWIQNPIHSCRIHTKNDPEEKALAFSLGLQYTLSEATARLSSAYNGMACKAIASHWGPTAPRQPCESETIHPVASKAIYSHTRVGLLKAEVFKTVLIPFCWVSAANVSVCGRRYAVLFPSARMFSCPEAYGILCISVLYALKNWKAEIEWMRVLLNLQTI